MNNRDHVRHFLEHFDLNRLLKSTLIPYGDEGLESRTVYGIDYDECANVFICLQQMKDVDAKLHASQMVVQAKALAGRKNVEAFQPTMLEDELTQPTFPANPTT